MTDRTVPASVPERRGIFPFARNAIRSIQKRDEHSSSQNKRGVPALSPCRRAPISPHRSLLHQSSPNPSAEKAISPASSPEQQFRPPQATKAPHPPAPPALLSASLQAAPQEVLAAAVHGWSRRIETSHAALLRARQRLLRGRRLWR